LKLALRKKFKSHGHMRYRL